MDEGTAASKRALRVTARHTRDGIDAETRRTASARACEHARRLQVYRSAGTIALYVAFGSELDVHALFTHACAAGKRVVLPRIRTGGSMEFAVCPDHARLVRNPLGFMEPPMELPAIPASGLDLVLLPGLSFDATAVRLGYGAGHYDRALAGAPQAYRIGIAFEAQLVARIPHEAHDLRMHAIVTEARVLTP